MATNVTGLRRLWFQVHKWIGLLLFVPLIIVSVTGSALVWHHWLDGAIYPQRHHAEAPAGLAPSAYAEAARARLAEGERLASLSFGEGAPVEANAARPPSPGRGRPVRTQIWLDPADARVVDMAGSDENILRVFHVLHGSLMVPEVGRQIVGWLGVAMLLSSLTGLWLWWPTTGRWVRGLRWRRGNDVNTNLHHQTGFWAAIPLAMLSLTGAWISFPAFFGAISGEAPPDRSAFMARLRAQPLVETNLGPDEALAAAQAIGDGSLAAITWPTDQAGEWRVELGGGERPAAYLVDDASGEAAAAPAEGERRSGGIARTMRRMHDGDGMGAIWQVVIFVGGLVPAILGITGVVMWLRTRGWRRDVEQRRKAKRAS